MSILSQEQVARDLQQTINMNHRGFLEELFPQINNIADNDNDVPVLPEVNIFFPDHKVKSAMESYLTKGGRGIEPAGKEMQTLKAYK